jgi:DNA-binding response OmpR family regulator
VEHQRVCLVVEDDDDIRGLISVVLSRAGFEVKAVGTGAEGIAAAADPAIA